MMLEFPAIQSLDLQVYAMTVPVAGGWVFEGVRAVWGSRSVSVSAGYRSSFKEHGGDQERCEKKKITGGSGAKFRI